MSWTALVAEYLLIGVQTSFWLALLVLRLDQEFLSLAVSWAESSPVTSSALLATVAIAFAYPLGMIVDTLSFRTMQRLVGGRAMKIWDDLLNPRNKVDRASFARAFYDAEARLYGADGRTGRLYRRRSRIRILRAYLLNLPLAACLLFVYTRSWLLIPLGLGLALATLYAFLIVFDQYHRMVKSEEKSNDAS